MSKQFKSGRLKRLVRGFSLVEMAIVLVILAFVLAALLLPLQAQRNLLFQSQTENTLELAKKALLGYAQANGKLPCPATTNGTGIFPDDSANQNPLLGGLCDKQLGFLPATTLGIQPVDAQGFALDGWGNRIRYAVTQYTVDPIAQTTMVNATFTSTNGISNSGMASLNPSLRVCRQASASPLTCSLPITASNSEVNYLINNAVAVIYSIGPTGNQAVGGADEAANLNNDSVFVSHESRSANDPNGEFDHIVTWISPYVLYNAMIEAGQLH